MLRRFICIVLPVLGVLALAGLILWLSRSHAPLLSMVPMGPVMATNGTRAFMVAVTNNSRSSIECHVCRDAVGNSVTKRVELSPKSGVTVSLPLKGASPWTLNVWYQRQPSKAEYLLRRIGARLRLCPRAPARQKLTGVEFTKDGSQQDHWTERGRAVSVSNWPPLAAGVGQLCG